MLHDSSAHDRTPFTGEEEMRLVAAHRELLEAIEEVRERGAAYFSATLEESLRHRDGYYDALARQAAAEAAFSDAKLAYGQARLTQL